MTLACNIHGLSESQRQRYLTLREQVEALVQGARELSHGFALTFIYDAELFLLLTEFITLERLCCPFLDFATELKNNGDLTLKLSGEEGVKSFLKGEFFII